MTLVPGVIAAGAGGGGTLNLPPTITSNGGGPTATTHTITGQTAVTTVTATGTAPIAFSISGGADQALFQIDASTGVLSYKAASLAGSHVVVVTATNAYGSDNQTITDAVAAIPVITSNGGGPTATIGVSAPLTPVTTVTATGGAPIAFTKTGGANQALFDLDSVTGVLVFHAASLAGSYVVIVTATNSWGTDSQTITVNVT